MIPEYIEAHDSALILDDDVLIGDLHIGYPRERRAVGEVRSGTSPGVLFLNEDRLLFCCPVILKNKGKILGKLTYT